MSFLRNVVTLLQGTAASQIIGVAALPVLSRLYDPSDFGAFQLYQSVLTVVMTIGAGRYELALLEARGPREVGRVLTLALFLNALVALVALVGMGATQAVGDLLPGGWAGVFVIALAIWIAGAFQTCSYLMIARQAYRTASNAKIVQTGGYAVLAVLIGLVSATPVGLIASDVAGRALAIGMMVRGGTDAPRPQPAAPRPLARRRLALATTARRWARYPMFSLPAGLLNTLAFIMTPLLLYGRFDLATLGQYAIVERFVVSPVGMLAQTIAQVFLGGIAQMVRERQPDAPMLFRRTVIACAKIAALPSLLMFFAGPWVIEKVFGPGWEQAGVYTRLVTPLLFVSFISAPASLVLNVLGAQRLQLAWDIGRCISLGLAWAAVYAFDLSATTAIGLHVLLSVIAQGIQIFLVDDALHRHDAGRTTGG